MVDGQLVRAVQNDRLPVAAVKLRDCFPARDTARVSGDGDDVLEDGVLGQHVEEIRSVHEPAQPLGDDPEERGECLDAGPPAHAGPRLVRNPTLRWLPSQNGLLADAPHLQSATRVSCLTRVWSGPK